MAHALAQAVPGPNPVVGTLTGRFLVQLERGDIPWLSAEWLASVDALCAGAVPVAPSDKDESFDELLAATGIGFRLGALRTFYCRSDDMIALADWRSSESNCFLRDLSHALIHATGHQSRLGRDLPPGIGAPAHGIEDLIAEIGAAIVCTALGIEPGLRHPDGLGAWVALLRSDDRALRRAVRRAREAADYLFARRAAQAAAFDRMEGEDARGCARRPCGGGQKACGRRLKRKRAALRCATVKRPGESLRAAVAKGPS